MTAFVPASRLPLDLRPATAADIDAVMTVMATAFDPVFGEAWSAAQVLGSLNAGNAWARIAWEQTTPLGFTLCRHIGPEAELLLIGVAPAARRGGVGRALLGTARRDSTIYGATTMFLEVRDGNAAANALYHAVGFVVVGRRRDYYRGADGCRYDAITLRAAADD